MRIITLGQMTLSKGMRFITVNHETNEVTTSFASSDGIMNASHVHMSPAECRAYAHELIIRAHELDPRF